MSARPLRIGTRASALALWQAHHLEALLAAHGAPAAQLVHIKTAGDVQSEVPLWQAGGRAFFTKEIDRALLEGSVDIAVHSLKDLSTQLDPGLTLAAALPRADARDAFLSRDGATLAQLPPGARVGTSSLRRRAFLMRARPDLAHAELRGNVPTRVEPPAQRRLRRHHPRRRRAGAPAAARARDRVPVARAVPARGLTGRDRRVRAHGGRPDPALAAAAG